MRAVVTRVLEAAVTVEGEEIARIGNGLLVLLASCEDDTQADIRYMADKVVNLRIFEDADQKMNRSLIDEGGELLLVSQFTLMGDARKGRRPSFVKAGAPQKAQGIFEKAVEIFRQTGVPVQTGRFQAHMEVMSVNNGPVTILLDSEKTF
ncbi:MAG: D-tyrosyl-tRNA(Tyr) deacylase [Christensenellaceae bacterium]|nr:D-tyrosyl-tRNA(Tyr) deacylase [Christensenellaceae bacterium]